MSEYCMYIDGEWCAAGSGQTYDAINPALGEPFGKMPKGDRDDARRAIGAANAASLSWRKTPLWERSAMCMRIAEILDSRREELADILCTELGKPRHQEAKFEANEASVPWRIAAEQAKYFEGHTKPCQDPQKRVLTFWQPRGVVAVITPWNFPAAICGEYLPFAIVMGNTVCWTPAPTAAATAIKIMQCIHEAGLPKGVINLVIGPGQEVGDELVINSGTHAVGMTGSPQTARIITARAGLKPRLFELGGNGPVIILADAEPLKIAASVASACFFAAGQVCSSAERIFVADEIAEPFVAAMVAETEKWKGGDPWNKSTTMGPQNNMAVVEKVGRHIEDAVAKGATILVGGNRLNRPGFFWQPTVLTNFTADALVNREESFGPVAPIRSFRREEEVWEHINACPLGLVSSVFTQDVDKAWRWAEQLDTGITVVNDWTHFWEHHLPFGGMSRNDSGLGRIGGRHTLEFMSNLKTIVFNIGSPTSF
ncbi:MAG: aldehyde dehydrogenase family protein [Planctomycetes bacterium]|nr:aldehyde dehydrogenase family protein [Planctomycetota bacterium]